MRCGSTNSADGAELMAKYQKAINGVTSAGKISLVTTYEIISESRTKYQTQLFLNSLCADDEILLADKEVAVFVNSLFYQHFGRRKFAVPINMSESNLELELSTARKMVQNIQQEKSSKIPIGNTAMAVYQMTDNLCTIIETNKEKFEKAAKINILYQVNPSRRFSANIFDKNKIYSNIENVENFDAAALVVHSSQEVDRKSFYQKYLGDCTLPFVKTWTYADTGIVVFLFIGAILYIGFSVSSLWAYFLLAIFMGYALFSF